jgi:thermitase
MPQKNSAEKTPRIPAWRIIAPASLVAISGIAVYIFFHSDYYFHEHPFYYVGQDRVDLRPDSEFCGFTLSSKTTPDGEEQIVQAIAKEGGEIIFSNARKAPSSASPDRVVVYKAAAPCKDKLNALPGPLRSNVQIELSVFSDDGGIAILTNEYTVQFDTTSTTEQIRNVIDALNAQTISTEINEIGPVFELRLPAEGSSTEALKKINKIRDYPGVKFAEPSFIELLSPAGAGHEQPLATNGASTYVVKPRDSLWAIARRNWGEGHRWPELWKLNKEIRHPDLIRPGWSLRLSAGSAIAEAGEKEPKQILPIVPAVDDKETLQSGGNSKTPHLPPNDEMYNDQWDLRTIGAEAAWAISRGSTQSLLAIVDDGVDFTHPDLRDKFFATREFIDEESSLGAEDQGPSKGDTHGTECAGVAAASTNNNIGIAGIAWESKILSLRVLHDVGRGTPYTDTTRLKHMGDAIRYAVNNGARVVSISLVVPVAHRSKFVVDAINFALRRNVIVVAAAGNYYPDTLENRQLHKDLSPAVKFPASMAGNTAVIAVASSNQSDELKTFSSEDGQTDWASAMGPEITIAAPGVHIWTTRPINNDTADGSLYTEERGTSMSTALVAGAAALLVAKHPNWTSSEVRDALVHSAAPLKFPPSTRATFGRLNIAAAAAL